jgi:hypothetical protein
MKENKDGIQDLPNMHCAEILVTWMVFDYGADYSWNYKNHI